MHVSKHPMGQRLKFKRMNQTPSILAPFFESWMIMDGPGMRLEREEERGGYSPFSSEHLFFRLAVPAF